MTHFVHCPCHPLQPIVGAISGGDAYISGMTATGEGVDGDIQSTLVEIKSYGLSTARVKG